LTAIRIEAADALDFRLGPGVWDFARDRAAEISAHWRKRSAELPRLFNGRVLMLGAHEYVERGGARVLTGQFLETDFADFFAWREFGFPASNACNGFSMAALRGADGAFLVGEMAPDTATAGLLYFPCGTPEPADVDATGALDLAGNLRRELLEETGIAIGELTAEPGWSLVRDRGYIALLKRVTAQQNAEALRTRIMRYTARETRPEFSDIRIVRSPADLDPRMPRFVTAFLEHAWRQ
jgi:8-oxo-dGTP pyrophosphatase MutT (NUDIX family)